MAVGKHLELKLILPFFIIWFSVRKMAKIFDVYMDQKYYSNIDYCIDVDRKLEAFIYQLCSWKI